MASLPMMTLCMFGRLISWRLLGQPGSHWTPTPSQDSLNPAYLLENPHYPLEKPGNLLLVADLRAGRPLAERNKGVRTPGKSTGYSASLAWRLTEATLPARGFRQLLEAFNRENETVKNRLSTTHRRARFER